TFNSQEAVTFKLTNFVCKSHNTSWVVFHNCRLKAVSREKIVLNMNATVLQPTKVVNIKIKVFKKANEFKPWLFDYNLDACRFIKHQYDPASKILYRFFADFSTINHSCPYQGQILVKDVYLRPELLKLPFPSGEYLLSLRWHFDKKLQFDTNVTFVFLEDLV
ncbi:hypothetical protein KR018_004030, partial [Drosophila ironensis]